MENILKLSEKTVLLTGPNTSIGRAIAVKLAELGAHVALVDSNDTKTQKLAEQIMDQREVHSHYGRACAVTADLTKGHHVQEAVATAAQTFGGIDIYIDALMLSHKISMIEEGASLELDRFIDVNLKAPILMTHEALRFLKGRRHGRIIYLIPDLPRMGMEGDAVTAASRVSLIPFARCLAREVQQFHVTVNCVAIGPTEEYLMDRNPGAASLKEAQEQIAKIHPAAKLPDGQDVSDLVAFLSSTRSGALTGQVLGASSGLTMMG